MLTLTQTIDAQGYHGGQKFEALRWNVDIYNAISLGLILPADRIAGGACSYDYTYETSPDGQTWTVQSTVSITGKGIFPIDTSTKDVWVRVCATDTGSGEDSVIDPWLVCSFS